MNLNLLKADNKITAPTKSQPERSITAKRIIEALLFSSHEPISLQKLKEIVNQEILMQKDEIKKNINELQENYIKEHRAFQIDKIADGFLLRTCSDMHPYISQLHKKKKPDKLGSAAMEVVAIIAYRSPITKSEIEQIRGVDCASPLQTLLERELVHVVGHKESLGKPRQFGVTKKFLKHFGLASIKQL